jgi:hypothetical protein
MNTVMLYMLMVGQVMSTIATLLMLAVMDKYLNNSHFTNEATIVAKEIPREGDRKWVGIILLLGLGGALAYNFRAVGVKLILMQMWTIFRMTRACFINSASA